MNKLKDLKEKRQRVWSQMEDLRTQAAESIMTEDQTRQWEGWYAEYKQLDDQIKIEEKAMKLEADLAGQEEENRENTPEKDKPTYMGAFEKMLRGVKIAEMDERERVLLQNNRGESMQLRAQSSTTTAGGYLIPTDLMRMIETAMLYECNFLDFATVLRTDGGNDIDFPTCNDTTNDGAILAESAQLTTTADLVFGKVTFKAYKLIPKSIILVPVELLQDSAFNLPQYIAQQFGERWARGMNNYLTTGTNSSQPQGIVTGAADSSVAPGASTITRNNLVDLKFSVNPVYRRNSKWMMNDTTLKTIMKIVDGDSRPVYQISPIVGQPDTIEGHQFVINPSMADIGASAKSVLFGDFKKYYVRIAKDAQMVVFNEKYMDYFQVGYTGYMRFDAKVMDAGTHPIKYWTHGTT
jgi:HK97 family phage major capsid protein